MIAEKSEQDAGSLSREEDKEGEKLDKWKNDYYKEGKSRKINKED